MNQALAPAAEQRAAGGPQPRGTLLVADRVVTLGHARMTATALMVRGSRVVWVGDDPDDAPPHQDRLELPGCVIGPAFVDAHAHLTTLGLARGGLDLSGVTTRLELLHALGAYAAHHSGRVVWGHGLEVHGFSDRFPDPDELAAVAGDSAVFVAFSDGHASLVDRRTLAAAPLSRVDGVERDGAGEPTGRLRREAHHIARRWAVGALSSAELAAARRRAVAHAAAVGIGSAHEMGGPDMMGLADFDAWVEQEWAIEVVAYWGALDIEVPLTRDLRQAGGDLCLDGSFSSRTAALTEPYRDAPSERGSLAYDDATLTDWLLEACLAGLQTSVHAVGDAALHQAVRCWRQVAERLAELGAAATIRRGRHRIEHAALLPPELLEDIANLGLVIVARPRALQQWGQPDGMFVARLGDRVANLHPYRSLSDRGIGLAFGSASNGWTLDPWASIVAAERHPLAASQSVSRLESVSMLTLGGRHAARQERYVGVVRAGMQADLAVFEGDPYEADDPSGTRSVLTVVKGRLAHGVGPLPEAPGRAG